VHEPSPTPAGDDPARPEGGVSTDALLTQPLDVLVRQHGDVERADGGRRARRSRSGVRTAVEWVAILAVALVSALLIKTFLLQAFYIPSGSMEPTLQIHDRVLVYKLSYAFGEPTRGDILVFERPPGEPDTEVKDLIKRVIALPGETISTDEVGRILIDGKVLDESGYLPEGTRLSTTVIPEQEIPPGHYWVMGDNRAHSKDSRVFGPIPESLIVGKAFVRVWPLGDVGFL
jgi:signal peptidase I